MSRIILSICFGIFIIGLAFILTTSGNDVPESSTQAEPQNSLPVSVELKTVIEKSEPNAVLRYNVGRFDSRFEITQETFLEYIKRASSVWENAAGLTLFRPDAEATLKINLVFDSRQERKIEEKRVKAKIDQRGKSYNMLVEEYDGEIALKQKLERDYDSEVSRFNERVRDHDSKVTYWNTQGGAPSQEYASLKQSEAELSEMKESLERRRQILQKVVAAINSLAESINQVVADNNFDVTNYNGKYVQSREFEKGLFDGREINIYEFDGDADLEITLVHELGHALGLGHVDDPESIMFYKLEKQDTKNIHLTAQDLKLLRERYQSAP